MYRPAPTQSTVIRSAGLLAGLVVIVAVLAAQFLRAPSVAGPDRSTPTADAGGDPGAIERGSALFAAQCATCHGATGQGDGPAADSLDPRPADFTSSMHRLHPDQELISAITSGVPGTAMPAFDERLTESEVEDVVAFIRSLQAQVAAEEISIPGPEECTVEPVSPLSFMPKGTISPKPAPTQPPPVGPDTFPWPQGEAAGQEEIDGITSTLREFTACANADDYPRRIALYTDRAIRPQFEALDEAGWQSTMHFIATPAVIVPEGERGWIDSISAVRHLPDGRVGAHVVTIDPVNHPHQSMAVVIFAKVGDRWLIDEVHQDTGNSAQPEGTPTGGGVPVAGAETPVTSAGLVVRLVETPAEVASGTLAVEITNANGEPVTDAQVELAVDMPEMAMGIQVTPAESQGDGRYQARMLFGMTGDWQVQVIVLRDGHDPTAFVFTFTID